MCESDRVVRPARACRITVAPRRGLNVMLRRRVVSGWGSHGSSANRRSAAARTIFISSWANEAPMQRRRPPPNGSHEYVPGGSPTNRSGRNANGSG